MTAPQTEANCRSNRTFLHLKGARWWEAERYDTLEASGNICKVCLLSSLSLCVCAGMGMSVRVCVCVCVNVCTHVQGRRILQCVCVCVCVCVCCKFKCP